MNFIKKIVCMLFIILGIFVLITEEDAVASMNTKEIINGIIQWKKSAENLSDSEPLLSNGFLENAGSTSVDWYVLGMGRAGIVDQYPAYEAIINDVVEKKYETANKLSEMKATEWHRISLAYLAAGGNPTAVGNEKINLIQDGVYDRGLTMAIDAQGLNGVIWGLLTLDSMRYKTPSYANETREDLLEKIVSKQLDDGGFSLQAKTSEIDLTAMAIQALAPYYNDETNYNGKTIRQIIDEALRFIQQQQQPSGTFSTGDDENLESTAQVVVALTALGINVETNKAYIKNGNTAIDGMKKFLQTDGGFIHSKKYNEDNPTSLPDQSNTMATEQALYAFVALLRQQQNARTLYDFRDEQSEEVKEQIAAIEQAIDDIASEESAKQALTMYKKLAIEEHSYVKNYAELAAYLDEYKIKNDSQNLVLAMSQNTTATMKPVQLMTNKRQQLQTKLSKEELAKVHQLPKEISTKDYVEITTLLQRLEPSQKEERQIVQQRKEEIEKLQDEIKQLNEKILEDLYPFSKLTLEDANQVELIVARYNKLPAYDQQQIVSAKDIEKSLEQMKTLKTQRIIKYIILGLLVITVSVFIILRIKRKGQHSE
ncbi:MAG: hypothetical protein KBT36_05415 [Kurthia sp.]|nr:hypothetical protein [Candidatus Kurthia equi]